MSVLPERREQIRQAHAQLIHMVVTAVSNTEARVELNPYLEQAVQSGWQQLVSVIRRILDGAREESLLLGLDEEDTVIIDSVLRAIQDPSTLPAIQQQADPGMAAPGLASIIHAAAHGDTKALQAISEMAEQMSRVGGDMGRLGGIMRKLINGERDVDVLCKGMQDSGRQLVQGLIEELEKLTPQ